MLKNSTIAILIIGFLLAFIGAAYSYYVPGSNIPGSVTTQSISSSEDSQNQQGNPGDAQSQSDEEHPWGGMPSNNDSASDDLDMVTGFDNVIIFWVFGNGVF